MLRTARYLATFALLALGVTGPALAAQDTPPVPVGALDQRSLTLANEIIEIAFPPDRRHEMLGRATEAVMAQARTASRDVGGDAPDADLTGIMNRYFDRVRAAADRLITRNSPALFTAMARGYARTFTYDELVQIRAFAGTPAGTAFMQRSMDMLTDPDVARANTAYMTETFQVLEPLMDELREELRAYATSHARHRDAPTGGTD